MEQTANAAAFAREPFSYDSACFAVALSTGVSGPGRVSRDRAVGAPLAFEVQRDRVLLWRVQVTPSPSARPMVLAPGEVEEAFREHSEDWSPAAILRAKNIGPVGPQQKDFIDLGLIPALEENILEKLDPLLRSIFFDALSDYHQRHSVSGRPDWLFRLVFRVLAGKVMTDRRLPGFARFVNTPDPDELLAAVNAHFGDAPALNADADTRRLVVERFWGACGFKHMSVPVLSSVWENTLVDEKVRAELSIHATPAGVARYVVRHLGFEDIPEGRYIVEPCCGGGAFLLAAMRRLIDSLPPWYSGRQRHTYLQKRLAGFDVDTFGVEVARDCLMLADYPNSNHWTVKEEDVFAPVTKSPLYRECLGSAAVVLCNPPFGKFTTEAKSGYGARSIHKPVELLTRVLDTIPHDATLGFVMPHLLLAGQSYPELRGRLAKRYNSVEIVTLPERGVFSAAEYETVVLIARDPRSGGTTTNVTHREVNKRDWPDFNRFGHVSREESQAKLISEAKESLAVPDLQGVWQYLKGYPTVDTATGGSVHRGVEWKIPVRDNKEILLSDEPKEGYRPGIPPSEKTELYSFQRPAVKYLCFLPKYRRRGSFDLPWDRPKVLMNGRRKGRSPWRLAAFPDETGLTCYHTFLALWPAAGWSPIVLSAILNGPAANAYIATHTVGRDVPIDVVKRIPVPRLKGELATRIDRLVNEYAQAVRGDQWSPQTRRTAERVLLEIDAAVLEGYDLPPRLERHILDYFNGHGDRRPVSHAFEDFFPVDFRPRLSLAEYLSEEVRRSTAKEFKRPREAPSADILRALSAAARIEEE